MIDDPTDLAPLLGSRICHDLASPLGALLAGLDLMDMTGPPTPEMALMRESLDGARAALDLMRLAFGSAGKGDEIAAGTLHACLAAALAARPRRTLAWALRDHLSRPEAQRLALALLCTLHALPRGGTLRVTGDRAEHTITAAGTVAADPALWDGLAGHRPLPPPDPRRIEFALLARALALTDGDARLSVSHGPDRLRLTLSQAKAD
jgi:histidine phosphotransferase ChpT